MVVNRAYLGYKAHNNQALFWDTIQPQSLVESLKSLSTDKMAEGGSGNCPPSSDKSPKLTAAPGAESFTSTSRSRPKLGRASTMAMFNKSFDHSILRQEVKPPKHRQMRRQSSVSDFVHSMLSKSKSHIVGIFAGKSEKKVKQYDQSAHSSSSRLNSLANSSIDLPSSSCEYHGPSRSLAESLPSMGSNKNLFDALVSNNKSIASRTFGNEAVLRNARLSPQRGVHSNFPTDKGNLSDVRQSSPKSKASSPHSPTILLTPKRNQASLATFSSQSRSHERKTSEDQEIDVAVPPRSVSSAPTGRHSLSGVANNLAVKDVACLFKRALVKSNSETFATQSADQLPIAKASSDGNCFKKEHTLQLGPTSSFMSRITNYLFLGSVEAAYSEPLLCKYNISSLIDMTNMSSANVPLQKKTDCPCPCVNKYHFRSRLNIGVDDIEWENLEQYFDELNTFINGARKKGGRILIFSYMGQSRAAAATIQHLMSQYKIPYNEAYHIVKSKRPQTKINSGFVKALRRLENKLGLFKDQNAATEAQRSLLQSQYISDASTTEQTDSSFPHVVRGAWLEC